MKSLNKKNSKIGESARILYTWCHPIAALLDLYVALLQVNIVNILLSKAIYRCILIYIYIFCVCLGVRMLCTYKVYKYCLSICVTLTVIPCCILVHSVQLRCLHLVVVHYS